MTSCGRSSEPLEDNGRRTKFALVHALPALTDFPTIVMGFALVAAYALAVRYGRLPG